MRVKQNKYNAPNPNVNRRHSIEEIKFDLDENPSSLDINYHLEIIMRMYPAAREDNIAVSIIIHIMRATRNR